MPSPDELMRLARACAARITFSKRGRLPALEDVEDEAEDEYGRVLDLLQEDELFEGVNLDDQQRLRDAISQDLPEASRPLVEELADQHTRHVWLQQEAAFYVGIAVGLRMAAEGKATPGQ